MPPGFPTCSSKKLEKIIKKHATLLRQNGSHRIYKSKITGENFTFPRRTKDFKTGTVKKILTTDLGLTTEQALKEVR